MRLFTKKLWNKADDGKDGGGAGAPPKSETQSAATPNDSPSQGEGDQFDELGYPITPAEPGKPDAKGDSAKESESKKADDKVEVPATGYGDEPPAVEPPKKDEPPPAKEETIDLGFEVKTDGLSKEDATKLLAFAKKHGVSKEVAQALIDDRKAELDQAKAAQEAAHKAELEELNRTRKEWHNELKNDPTFGGEKFGHNVMRVEKVVQDFMPHTKKILTERKAMLPPYVMRDLAKIADRLYETESLVQGNPSVPDQNAKGEDDPLAFYNS